MNLRTSQMAIAAVFGLLMLGGGFAAGMTVGKGSADTASASASPSGAGRQFVTGGAPGGAGARGAAGQQVVTGRVLSVNDGSITVEVRSGGGQGASPTVTSEIVLVGSSTKIVRTAETDIKVTDLKANDQIQIVGTTDATGSVSASAIVVGGNALQQLFGGGAPGGAPGGAGGRPSSPSPSPTK
ncbi:MAG TPA: hypothetical protein VEP48_10280 [Methylomirabilota bacterium]|nr:hypothetical protein [Methylomirabilota bacterium]